MARPVPVSRELRWLHLLPQIIVLSGIVAVASAWAGRSGGFILGASAYLAYAFGSRAWFARHHRKGMRLVRARQWAAAIPEFEESYCFFSRHAWLDRFRSVVLLSASGASYREMALINKAFCLAQAGQGAAARSTYEQALSEFPDSPIAQAALNVINAGTAAA